MIAFIRTIEDMKDVCDQWLEEDSNIPLVSRDNNKVNDLIQMELMYINQNTLEIVGTEAEDYKPKSNEIAVWVVS